MLYVDQYRFPAGAAGSSLGASDYAAAIARRVGRLGQLALRAGDVARAYRRLADDESRRTFRASMIYQFGAPFLSSIPKDAVKHQHLQDFMTNDLCAQEEFDREVIANGTPIQIWRCDHESGFLLFASTKYGIYWALHSGQYYFDRAGVRIAPEPGDVVLDCGCFLAETSLRFAADVGEAGRVYAFDPLPQHVAVARQMAQRNGFGDRLQTFQMGVGRQTNVDMSRDLPGLGEVTSVEAVPGRMLAAQDPQVRIDDFCREKALPRVDYIKMDIEGSELDALSGAHETIMAHQPKLAVCVYHRPSDLWDLPNRVAERYPFYDLYLQHYSLHLEETVMYAMPRHRARAVAT